MEAEDREGLLGVDLCLDDLGITGMLAPRALRTAKATDARLRNARPTSGKGEAEKDNIYRESGAK